MAQSRFGSSPRINVQAATPHKVTSIGWVLKKNGLSEPSKQTRFPRIMGSDAELPQPSRLTFDLDVDIAVVGAGLAGLTVALESARLGASVAVLEGRQVGWNASGHQLGTVMPGYALAIDDLIARVGFETTRELWALSQEGADYIRNL